MATAHQKKMEDEKALVMSLDVPAFDPNRTFGALSQLKMSRKDRHMKALSAFSQLLEKIYEDIENDVLAQSRVMRESLEGVDEGLEKCYKDMETYEFLIVRDEVDLKAFLVDLKGIIASRNGVLDTFASDLDGIECKRADVVGRELKTLVDTLIAIAHQLPDEIEHIVETESFELNTILTANRQAHDNLIGLLRKRHVEVEIECLQRWEDSRRKWRQLRHEKAITEFTTDIHGEFYLNPPNRYQYLQSVQRSQQDRQNLRFDLITRIKEINADNINADDIVKVQQKFATIHDDEITNLESCFFRLNEMRSELNDIAARRVEAIRKELHVYGALKIEPDLLTISNSLERCLADTSNNNYLADVWRLGGGLKPDILSCISDLRSTDVAYDPFVKGINDKLEYINCGFSLKQILEERGRLASLDKLRGIISKMRTVARNELPATLDTVVKELEDFCSIDTLVPMFKQAVLATIGEIKVDLNRFNKSQQQQQALSATGSVKLGGASTGTLKKTTSVTTQKLDATTATPNSANLNATSKSSRGGGRTVGGTSNMNSSIAGTFFEGIDPSSVKVWHRKLAILFFASDLPLYAQEACSTGIFYMAEQKECNRLVDEVVLSYSAAILKKINLKYKKLTDQLAKFLESQAIALNTSVTNLTEFYIIVARIVEAHRKAQKSIDDRTDDQLWDASEDFRLEREDREKEFEAACQKIRESTNQQEILDNFDQVLKILDTIQDSYRIYHGKACFHADKYPLRLIDEFRTYQKSMSFNFFVYPHESHGIRVDFLRIYNETIRLNRRNFENNPDENPIPDIKRLDEADNLYSDCKVEEAAGEDGIVVGMDSDYVCEKGHEAGESTHRGAYCYMKRLDDTVALFNVESSFQSTPPEPDDGGATSNAFAPPEKPPVEVYPDFPWLWRNPPTPLVVPGAPPPPPPKTADELTFNAARIEALDEFDREDYYAAVAKVFIPLADTTVLAPEQLELYTLTQSNVDSFKSHQARITDPAYLRSTIPKDDLDRDQVLFLDITSGQIKAILIDIRDSLVSHVEIETTRRINRALTLTTERKSTFTEELEDRLRTHWPRRGRVETQIKQPREAELSSHEEKTYRHILAIQSRMKELQKKFLKDLDVSKKKCDEFVNNMNGLRNELSGTFRNLATLQAIDSKARQMSINFAAASVEALSRLRTQIDNESASATNFAQSFRQICPLQAPGVEGGYSESEIAEIAVLVDQQCEEIQIVKVQWHALIVELGEHQTQSAKSHGEFCVKYDKTAQDLAMAEGLGQKYGAPRRRAQERIRSEVAWDEQNAGKVDDLLNKVETTCISLPALEDEPKDIDSYAESSLDNGRSLYMSVNLIWKTLNELRLALNYRTQFLKVQEAQLPFPALPWIMKDMIPAPIIEGDVKGLGFEDAGKEFEVDCPVPPPRGNLMDIMDEIDSNCRKETRQLYESEGKGAMLANGGVPESLQAWLAESKEKILGRHGYRETAWKRLWAQVARVEYIFARKGVDFKELEKASKTAASNSGENNGADSGGPEEDKDEEDEEEKDYEHQEAERTPEDVQNASYTVVTSRCLQVIYASMLRLLFFEQSSRISQFDRKIKSWELGRSTYERQLRPRLGSPDAVDELNALDALEKQRSKEMKNEVVAFRSLLIKLISEHMKSLMESISISAQGFILLIDSTVRQEVIIVPPDTAIPKKRMTMKRLRKAQRLRQAVSQGLEDRSKERNWPAIPLKNIVSVIKDAETLVPNLSELASPPPPPSDKPPEDVGGKGAKGKATPAPAAAKGKGGAPVVEVPTEKPSFVPTAWVDNVNKSSSIKGNVSTAHRVVVLERDLSVEKYKEVLQASIDYIRSYYDTVLSQEDSWGNRWNSQVETLRQGNL